MAQIALSRRYARALLEVSIEENSVEVVAERLQALASAFEESAELRSVLTSPSYDREVRLKVLQALLASAGKVPTSLENTLRLLNDRSKLEAIPGIAREFLAFADARAGRVRGVVTSAQPLSPDQLAQLTQELAALSGKQVVVETRTDPSLIGGVSAQVGSMLYDGSLRTQLQQLRQELINR
ncbi:MAG TPA: ATP synthase F1 subunit delta [Myxococcaceae bacterium]|nr:ATP synthase F1 subunit delta [Myxococcaceae bacterium]